MTFRPENRYLQALFLLLVLVCAFTPALFGDFVFDDDVFIVNNPQINDPKHFWTIWFSPLAGTEFVPVSYTLFWLEYNIFGENTLPYHLINIFLHLCNTLLIIHLLRKFKVPFAFACGLVFAIHPFNADAVAWIFQARTLLSVLLVLLSTVFFLKFYEKGRYKSLAISVLFFALSLMSKITLILYPVMLLTFLCIKKFPPDKREILSLSPFFLLSLIMGSFNMYLHARSMPADFVPTGNFVQRLALAGKNFWFYIEKTVYPDVNLLYSKFPLDDLGMVDYLPLLGMFLAFGGVILFSRSNWKNATFFVVFYFLCIFPTLGFFDNAHYQLSYTSNHWHYFAILALIVGFFYIMHLHVERGTYGHRFAIMTIAGLAATLFMGTNWRAAEYKSMETLMTRALESAPDSWAANFNLGVVNHRKLNYKPADTYYRKTIEIKPSHDKATHYLGILHEDQKLFSQALTYYEKALSITPNDKELLLRLARMQLRASQIKPSKQTFSRLENMNYNNAEVFHSLGIIHSIEGNAKVAQSYFLKAKELTPDDPILLNNLRKVQRALSNTDSN